MTNPEEAAYLRDAANEIARLGTKGVPVAVDPDLADYMGAFIDEALTSEEALASLFDTIGYEEDIYHG